MWRSRLRLVCYQVRQSLFFCHGDPAALFYFLAAKSMAAMFRQEFGTADTTAAFLNTCYLLCLILAGNEGVGVHQMMSLLLGNAATPRGKRPTPAASRTFHRGHGAHGTNGFKI